MPIDEDSDEKIRRNLIASSGAVLLAMWLDIDPSGLLTRMLGAEALKDTTTWKIWTVASFVLLYFGLRYRFSNTMSEAIQGVQAERSALTYELKSRVLQKELESYAKTRLIKSAPSFSENIESTLDNYFTGGQPSHLPLRIENARIDELSPTHAYQGKMHIDARWGDGVRSALRVIVPFKLKRGVIFLINIRWITRVIFYSKSSTSFVVPATMFAVAFFLSISKLAISICTLLQNT